MDIVEGLTPPPAGDLSIREARDYWGDKVVLWINFPASVFWEGPDATQEYTQRLIASDPSGRLIIGTTAVGTSMVADDDCKAAFESGMAGIVRALEEHN